MARSRLRERHQQNLRRKLELLKAEQGVVKTEREDREENESEREANSVPAQDEISQESVP